jgi:hypothetical protein
LANYSIFVLDESDLSLSSGILDGVNQGDGSHLNGRTLTIDNPNYTEIFIRDNETNFQDNDGNQLLDGAQEVDGTTYADGTRVEAEFGFLVSYQGQSWQAIAFNVTNSSPAFGTIEGIAFVEGPGGFPPSGVPLQICGASEGPSFQVAEYSTPICFDAGTPILTPDGWRPVETLSARDLVMTRDSGPQPITWTGRRKAWGVGRFAPVEIPAGLLGNSRILRVSQQHRLLWQSPKAEVMFGASEVLLPAVALKGRFGIELRQNVPVEYCHILFDGHELVSAAGMWAESLFLGETGLNALESASREEILKLFPDLERIAHLPARPMLKKYEALALVG